MGNLLSLDELKKLPKTKDEAINFGVRYYFTNIHCRNGHLAQRNIRGECFECVRGRAKRYRNNNPTKIELFNKSRRTKEWREKTNREKKLDYQKNPEKYRFWSLKRLYGVTEESFKNIWNKQGKKCAICGSTDRGDIKSNNLNLDHDHQTKKIRGILCSPCNKLLGDARDNPSIIDAAINYLKKYSA